MTKSKSAIKDKFTKNQILGEISDNTDLSKKQVSAVLDELYDLIERQVKKEIIDKRSPAQYHSLHHQTFPCKVQVSTAGFWRNGRIRSGCCSPDTR